MIFSLFAMAAPATASTNTAEFSEALTTDSVNHSTSDLENQSNNSPSDSSTNIENSQNKSINDTSLNTSNASPVTGSDADDTNGNESGNHFNAEDPDQENVTGPDQVTQPIRSVGETGVAGLDAESDEEIKVVVYSEKDAIGETKGAIERRGGEITSTWDDWIYTNITADKVSDIADIDTVYHVRQYVEPSPEGEIPEEDISEGVGIIGADDLHQGGITGEDITIAVMDSDFDPENEKIEDQVVDEYKYGNGFYPGEDGLHGTSSAEVVADMAPDADLALVSTRDKTFNQQMDFIQDETDADIITYSMSFPTSSGPLDGTDRFHDRIDDATDEGLLFVAAAGNYGQADMWHGEGTERDFPQKNENVLQFDVDDGEQGELILNWEDQSHEYKLHVETICSSSDGETTESQESSYTTQPYERVVVGAASERQDDSDDIECDGELYVESVEGNFDTTFQIEAGNNTELEQYTPHGSLRLPATSSEVITVGAVNQHSSEIRSSSSRGPTIDGRQGIDVVAPSAVSQHHRDTYGGTSAATPHVAGLAGLMAHNQQELTSDEIRRAIEDSAVGTIEGDAADHDDHIDYREDLTEYDFGEGYIRNAIPVMTDAEMSESSAGNFEHPQSVEADVDVGGLSFNALLPPGPDQVEIEVGDEPVTEDPTLIGGMGDHSIQFHPPSQPSAGSYDATITLSEERDGVELTHSETLPNAITYSGGDTSEVAISQIVDVSGSMDCGFFEPGLCLLEDAQDAAQHFTTTARGDDYISIVSYSSGSTIEQALTQKEGNEQQIRDTIESLSAGGATNIGAGLEDGLDTLHDAPAGAQEAGVLMTDGERNRGPSEDEIVDDIVGEYNDNDYCLYTIAFSDAGDQAFMEDVAAAADCGEYKFVPSPTDSDGEDTLGEVYDDIRGEVAGDDQFGESTSGTLEQNQTVIHELPVDNTIIDLSISVDLEGLTEELHDSSEAHVASADGADGTVTASDETAEMVRLIDPSGEEIDPNESEDVDLTVGADSIVYRVSDPADGVWSYTVENTDATETEYEASVTGFSQTSMAVDSVGESHRVGGQANVMATVSGPNGSVSGASVDATVTTPDGNTTDVALSGNSDGVYNGLVELNQSGTYSATVTATDDDLVRTETTSWEVTDTEPVSLTQSATPTATPGEDTELVADVTLEENVSLDSLEYELSSFDHATEDATITAEQSSIDREPESLEYNESESVAATVSVPEDTPSGQYEGVLLRSDGESVSGEPVELTVRQLGTFEVSIDETIPPITEGQELQAEVVVTNVGDEEATREIQLLDGDDEPVSTTELTLSSGATELVTLSWETEDGASDTDVIAVESGDDRSTQTVSISESGSGGGNVAPPRDDEPSEAEGDEETTGEPSEEATFVVEALTVPDSVESGETETIAVTVENTGDVDGVYEGPVHVDDERIDTVDVQVSAGQTETVDVEHTFTESGTEEVSVDGDQAASVTVDESEPDSDDGLGPSGITTLALVISAIFGGLIFARWRA